MQLTGQLPPSPALFTDYPGLAYETYLTAADPDLSDGAPPPIVLEVQSSARRFVATWLDVQFLRPGEYKLGRFAVTPAPGVSSVVGRSSFYYTDACTPGTVYGGPFELTPVCLGDLDGDNDVEFSDLGQLLASYELDDGGDLDCDGDTDLSDLASSWRTTAANCSDAENDAAERTRGSPR